VAKGRSLDRAAVVHAKRRAELLLSYLNCELPSHASWNQIKEQCFDRALRALDIN
jgi:hypothetical protein